ncbi:hypothetical protein [Clostridium sp. ZS2-4]|uniref:hypothetical protein n=1 Tax=Clostridium sp. ZS2-4 TaxID=2987703 RepID=UPI00227A1AF4|nr:hypothetical protein [Clostridium sp. ZS2-4]MCY6354271.1 hypothetical protein [Clostridium sp. ZS2-4]
MKEFKVLKFLDKFKVLFEKFGVDYEIMRKILQMKLVMDGRRIPTIMNKSNKEKEEENSFFKSLGLYALFGLIIVVLIIPKTNLIFQMSCVFGILMFMIMTTLISDFSSVLLDVRDKNIIFSKPVNNKTINAAKFIHVFIYMFSLTIILENSRNTYYIIFSILAAAVPVISILIYIKLVPSFERNLQKLNVNSGKTDKRKKKLFYKLSNVFCSNKQEQIFFRFTYYMIKNEKSLSLKYIHL